MESITNQKEAICCILEIQEILKRIDYHGYFGFVFEMNKNKEFVLTTKSKCQFLQKDKKNISFNLKFIGTDIVEATNKFMDFFLKGGKGIIEADEDSYQLHIEFHYSKGWVIDKSYCGSYSFRE